MKFLNVPLNTQSFNKLNRDKKKEGKSWRDYFMDLYKEHHKDDDKSDL